MNDLEIFCSAINSMEARVVARLPRPGEGQWRLAGRVHGPHCKFARTLPSSAVLQPRGGATVLLQSHGGATVLLAEAVLPDPCFWTPELPMLYDVQVELLRDEAIVASAARSLAVRPLSPQAASLAFAARRWVLRGVARGTCPDNRVEDWRRAGAAMLLSDPDAELADAAAEQGVLLLVPLAETAPEPVAAALRRLARLSAVGIAAIGAGASLSSDVRLAAPNLLLAAHCRAGDLPAADIEWAHVLLVESADVGTIGRLAAATTRPVIAFRPAARTGDVAAARAACDALQRALAPHADLAGYIV